MKEHGAMLLSMLAYRNYVAEMLVLISLISNWDCYWHETMMQEVNSTATKRLWCCLEVAILINATVQAYIRSRCYYIVISCHDN